MEQSFVVQGMTCEHCVRAVTEELSKLYGVTEVDVDLATGTATLVSAEPVPVAAVAAAVDEAGYELVA